MNVIAIGVISAMMVVPELGVSASHYSTAFGSGELSIQAVDDNAVRVRYTENQLVTPLPDWIYEGGEQKAVKIKVKRTGSDEVLTLPGMTLTVDKANQTLTARDVAGKTIFVADKHALTQSEVQNEPTYIAEMRILSPGDEHIFGLGQFQDGYNDVRGLSRRLTQVNTQISIPMIISNKGYGLLWNNYGITEFNPCGRSVELTLSGERGETSVVNVTSTAGNVREVRENNGYKGVIDVAESGKYRILLDVGQDMARRHNLAIDRRTVVDLRNMWLPPTTSLIVELSAGRHELTAQLSRGDKPVVYYDKVDNSTTLRSEVAESVDYTLFAGNADEVMASYRRLTGNTPLLPKWAYGYIHCRERYKSQDELLENAAEFRRRNLPVDVIVQDWQYWGKYGWNAMRFDEEYYPDPAAMVSKLHDMNMRLMLSVWAKADENSEVGKQMSARNYYIPGTTWVDFFNQEAADFYWQNSSSRLLKPYAIDAWWQDATEPENDDLRNRRVMNGKLPGERVRNAFPLMVNRVVYAGLRSDDPERRPLILTRCAFPGIQRFGVAVWSGDVGNDWVTLRRQITSGLGVNAAGHPWWTYDAGGFFRPGNQYSDSAYKERMLRWIEASVFLPLMRVHGYMSDTEPWRYGEDTEQIIEKSLSLRYRLLPYIYSEAAQVANSGTSLMRPLVFDFPSDDEAMAQEIEYMFGKSLLVNPVTEESVKQWRTYLPSTTGGWYDFYNGKHYGSGEYVEIPVTMEQIPVLVKAGSIVPVGPNRQYADQTVAEPTELRVYPGADGSFVLYDDDGTSNEYESGKCARIALSWNDSKRTLTLDKRQGAFDGMSSKCSFKVVLPDGSAKKLEYDGKRVIVKL